MKEETKTLILMMGLPKSGKSTKAKEITKFLRCPIVCPDDVRLAYHGQRFMSKLEPEVWRIVHVMVDSLFLSGQTQVILDATNTTLERRKQWHDKDYDVIVYEIETSYKECMERAKDDLELIPIIDRMHTEYESTTTIEPCVTSIQELLNELHEKEQ